MVAKVPELAKELDEWFWRRQALRAARAQLPGEGELAARAFEQVRLLREVAGQVAEPAETPPPGSRPALLLSLRRDQVYWMLAADARTSQGKDADLAALWQRAPRDKLLRAAGGEETLAAVQRVLVEMSPTASLDATDEDVAHVQAFADALYADLAAPRRRAARVVAQRWIRLAVLAAAVLSVALVVRRVALGPNLAKRGPMRTSSQFPGCAADSGCADLLFHTKEEANPWVEFDLAAPTPIHVIDVANRSDCCEERAVPLIAEISLDRVHWKEVGRRDKEFSSWTVKFPRTVARYVRLRVGRPSWFGLDEVTIR